MIRFNKYSFIAGLVFLISLSACKEVSQSVEASNFSSATSSTVYLSNDKQNEYIVRADEGSTDGEIYVEDVKQKTNYILKRVESASGVKYENKDGYTLWTKGSAFTWSKNDETLAKGGLKTTEVIAKKEEKTSTFNVAHYGNYVSSSYADKDKGSDWVAVIIKPINQFTAKISIRSRADKKRATCSFDGIGYVGGEHTLKVNDNGTYMVFTFSDNQVNIATEPESDHDKLAFYCSGGGSLIGEYSKIDSALDINQMDKLGYSKFLEYNTINFMLEERNNTLTVTPSGLDISEPQTIAIEGEIINAEVGDLNNDSFPELLIYSSIGDQRKGRVIGYSVNNGKSMSMIHIANVTETAPTNTGYQGYDEFAMVEGTFVQRFPIYKNNEPTGETRQIQYKLEDGEAMRQLVVDKTMDY